MNKIEISKCHIIKTITKFTDNDNNILEISIMEKVIAMISNLNNVDMKDLDDTEEIISAHIKENDTPSSVQLSQCILVGFIRPICTCFLKGKINHGISLYRCMIDYLINVYRIPRDTIYLLEDKKFDFVGVDEIEISSQLAETTIKYLGIFRNNVENEVMKDFMNQLNHEYAENFDCITDTEKAIIANMSSNKNLDPEQISLCLYKGFIQPLCSAMLRNDYLKAKLMYFSMIDYLLNVYQIHDTAEVYAQTENDDKPKKI